jgi:glycerate kinase
VLVCADSFKGTFSSEEVNAAIATGFEEGGGSASTLAVADGGEGTMAALVLALGGTYREVRAADPLGREVNARFALLDDGRAAVDVAEASGLWRVAEQELDAWAASTRGTGELIAAAVAAGSDEVLVGAGGSATTDGGLGAVRALQAAGAQPGIEVICDVDTPWEQAPSVFGPQKGADPETVRRLERRLDQLAERAPRDPRGVRMTGCGGGISGGLWAFCGASLSRGAAFVLDAIGFDEALAGADLVLTGEGRLDDQTPRGKAVAEIAGRCRRAGVRCCAISGRNELSDEAASQLGLAEVWEASTLEEITARARAASSR